jgi:hypothetical protein
VEILSVALSRRNGSSLNTKSARFLFETIMCFVFTKDAEEREKETIEKGRIKK